MMNIDWDKETRSEDSTADVVWWAKFDSRYMVEVVRAGDYTAELSIYDHEAEDKLLHSNSVHLDYGARFGPDVGNIEEWQELVVNVVDSLT